MPDYAYDYVTLSDDGGASWRTVNNRHRFPRMDEAVLTQLPNGSVLLNMRHKASLERGRAIAVSHDGGETFGPIAYDAAARVTRLPSVHGQLRWRHLLLRPHDPQPTESPLEHRHQAVTWESSWPITDGGATWGYSCLVKGPLNGDAESGGIVYEAHDASIKFARFPLAMEREDT